MNLKFPNFSWSHCWIISLNDAHECSLRNECANEKPHRELVMVGLSRDYLSFSLKRDNFDAIYQWDCIFIETFGKTMFESLWRWLSRMADLWSLAPEKFRNWIPSIVGSVMTWASGYLGVPLWQQIIIGAMTTFLLVLPFFLRRLSLGNWTNLLRYAVASSFWACARVLGGGKGRWQVWDVFGRWTNYTWTARFKRFVRFYQDEWRRPMLCAW